MRLLPAPIEGVFAVELDPMTDDRGSFTRTFDADEFRAAGIDARVDQCSVSFNHAARTLRGMHFQRAPYGETKLVRCTRGGIFDVVVDARPESPTFRSWFALELDAVSRTGLVVPPGVAHGFLTLEPESEVSYQISVPFRPDASAGFRWDDPEVGIIWPMAPVVMSDRDRDLPMLVDATPVDHADRPSS